MHGREENKHHERPLPHVYRKRDWRNWHTHTPRQQWVGAGKRLGKPNRGQE